MATTPIPNMNPTGVVGSGAGNTMPGQTGTPFSTFGTGGPGSMNFGNSANPNPTAAAANPFISTGGTAQPQGTPAAAQPSAAAPTTSMGTTSSSAGPGGSVATAPGVNQPNLANGLNSTFGSGFGSLLLAYLQSNGGYNGALTQQAVDSQINAMGQQTQLGANNLAGELGAAGVSGSSSEFSGALTNYENQAVTQENAITAQEYYNMWNQSQQNELSLIQSVEQPVATEYANQPTWMDYLNEALGIAGGVAGMATGVSEAGSLGKIAGSL